MKKIIAAFDGLKFSESTLNYAVHAAKLLDAHLVGVFLDDRTYTSYKIYDLVSTEGSLEKKLNLYDNRDEATRDESVSQFEKACRIGGINHSIHRDRNVALQELIHESIYADLLIVDKKETFTHYEENTPTRFIRDLLSDVQCPVLIVPQKYRRSDKIIMLYDGAPSSVHAVKMYNYIFSLAEHNAVEVISVRSVDNTSHIPDNRLMKEFMKRHYPTAEYITLKGLAELEILRYLQEEKQNTMVVLGAYRRGRVSRWFRESMADALMKELNMPLFIAHTK